MLQVPAAQRGTSFRAVSEDGASLGIVLGKPRGTSWGAVPRGDTLGKMVSICALSGGLLNQAGFFPTSASPKACPVTVPSQTMSWWHPRQIAKASRQFRSRLSLSMQAPEPLSMVNDSLHLKHKAVSPLHYLASSVREVPLNSDALV